MENNKRPPIKKLIEKYIKKAILKRMAF